MTLVETRCHPRQAFGSEHLSTEVEYHLSALSTEAFTAFLLAGPPVRIATGCNTHFFRAAPAMAADAAVLVALR
eukprot:205357-Prymnesium_polylepis.2